jgi:hypothetical protein
MPQSAADAVAVCSTTGHYALQPYCPKPFIMSCSCQTRPPCTATTACPSYIQLSESTARLITGGQLPSNYHKSYTVRSASLITDHGPIPKLPLCPTGQPYRLGEMAPVLSVQLVPELGVPGSSMFWFWRTCSTAMVSNSSKQSCYHAYNAAQPAPALWPR